MARDVEGGTVYSSVCGSATSTRSCFSRESTVLGVPFFRFLRTEACMKTKKNRTWFWRIFRAESPFALFIWLIDVWSHISQLIVVSFRRDKISLFRHLATCLFQRVFFLLFFCSHISSGPHSAHTPTQWSWLVTRRVIVGFAACRRSRHMFVAKRFSSGKKVKKRPLWLGSTLKSVQFYLRLCWSESSRVCLIWSTGLYFFIARVGRCIEK